MLHFCCTVFSEDHPFWFEFCVFRVPSGKGDDTTTFAVPSLTSHCPTDQRAFFFGGKFYAPESISSGSLGVLVCVCVCVAERLWEVGNRELQRDCIAAGWASCHGQAF